MTSSIPMIPMPATVVWNPYLPPAIVACIAIALAALAIVAAWRCIHPNRWINGFTLLLRLTIIAFLCLLLLGPSTPSQSSGTAAHTTLHLLIDTSASMATPDVKGQTRLHYALSRWLDPAFISKLERSYRVRLHSFDERLQPATTGLLTERPMVATGKQTLLAESVARAVARTSQKEQGTTLVVLSDGHDTQHRPAAPVALESKRRGVIIHTVTLGSDKRAADLSLQAEATQPYQFVNEEGRLLVSVHQTGADMAVTRLKIELMDAKSRTTSNHPATRDETATQVREVHFAGRPTVQETITLKHLVPGEYAYRISVQPLAEETELSNNEQWAFVEVVPSRMRILLLEGQPGWDTKFLAMSLRRDERVDLTQVSQISEARREVLTTFDDSGEVSLPPASIEEWGKYDLVILGRSVEHLMTRESAKSLVEYVSRGGGRLLLACGRPWSRVIQGMEQVAVSLAQLEPAEVTGGDPQHLKLAPTEPGWLSACFSPSGTVADRAATEVSLESLPPVVSVTQVRALKPGTVVLATGAGVDADKNVVADMPLLMTMRYGSGEIAALYAAGLWRWTLGATAVRENADFYDRFWSGLVRQLILGADARAGEDLSLRPLPRNIAVGDAVRLELTARSESLARQIESLEVITAEGISETVTLIDDPLRSARRYAKYLPQTKGIHRVRTQSPTDGQWVEALFYVNDVAATERLHTASDPTWMQTLASISGGMVLDPDKPEALLDVLAHRRASWDGQPIPVHIWDRMWLLFVLLLWMGVEWLIRRAWGLP